MSTGTLFIVSAASGTGKTSLTRALIKQLPQLKLSISHTTRPKRACEIQNQHYFYVSDTEFQQLIAADAFLEYAEVFGHYYGTSRVAIEENLKKGIDMLLDIDWQGALQIKNKVPCTTIFLLPPSKAELRSRLEKRKRETFEQIAARLALSSTEIAHFRDFDYTVVNDDFNEALAKLKAIITAQRLLTVRRHEDLAPLLAELL